MVEETTKKDTRRWFQKVTPCKNLNKEIDVKFVEMSEFNPAWGKKPIKIEVEEPDGKE